MAVMPKTATAAPAGDHPPVTGYSWFVLAILCLVYVFNFMDRQLMSVLGEQIKTDLKLTDTQLGLMTGLFFALFYTILGVVAGWLADRTVRVRVLAVGCFLWSLFTLLCGKATSFPMMAIARMGVGVGEAAGAPPSYSIVSDYFPAHRRGLALALFSLGVPFGMAFGAFFGPTIAEAYDWRMAFISIGVAGMAASVLLLVCVREPKRGQMDVKLDVHMEEAPALPIEKESFGSTINQFFGRPALLTTALGCGLAAFVGYATLNWTSPFLQRVKGADLGEIRIYYSLMLAVAMGLGTWLSGALVDKLAARGKVWFALVPAAALALTIPGHLLFVWVDGWAGSMAALAIPTFLNIFYLAPALAVVQNSVRPGQRTMAGALLLLVLNLIGLGGGPTLIGILSDNFAGGALASSGLTLEACRAAGAAADAACAPAVAGGLQTALYWLTPFYVAAVLALLAEAWALRREDRHGVPNDVQIAKNAMMVKLLVGLGGIVAVLIVEALLFGEPLTRDLAGIGAVVSGETLTPRTMNGLIRCVLLALCAVVALAGIFDVAKRGKRAA